MVTALIFGFARVAIADYSGTDCAVYQTAPGFMTIEGYPAGNASACTGGQYVDSFFMYGGNDTTYGKGNNDTHRGAYGNDTLSDGVGSDTDYFCDGAGFDYINMQDNDPNDSWTQIADGDNEAIPSKDSGDVISPGWSSCPY